MQFECWLTVGVCGFWCGNAWAGNWDLVAVGYCLWFFMTEFTWGLCTLNLSSMMMTVFFPFSWIVLFTFKVECGGLIVVVVEVWG